MNSRRIAVAVLSCLALPAVGAALAWACTNQAGISTDRTSGAPGTQVSVRGTLFVPGQPVEIRWNEVSGPVLATTRASADQTAWISTTVTIPNASPDTYALVAVGRNAQGGVAGTAPASFTVTGAGPAQSTTPGGNGPEQSGTESTTSGAGSAQGGTSSRTASGGQAGVDPRRQSSDGGPAPPGADSRAGGELASGEVAFPGTAGRGVEARSGSGGASERSAAGDLWSGFDKDDQGSLTSLTATTGTASGQNLLLAAGLAALGALTLAAACLAALRRRRAAVGESSHRPS